MAERGPGNKLPQSLKQTVIILEVSVGQEFGSSFAEWFGFGASLGFNQNVGAVPNFPPFQN